MTIDNVRALHPDDGALATALHARCFDAPGERAWTGEEFASLLSTPGCFGLLLIADGKPCGLAVVRIAADEAELLTVGVVPEARRRGGAGLLMTTLHEHCRRGGVRYIFLEVADDNPAARRLYEKHGYASVARRRDYFDRGSHGRIAAHVMRRDFGNSD